jgi:hypothetical protein
VLFETYPPIQPIFMPLSIPIFTIKRYSSGFEVYLLLQIPFFKLEAIKESCFLPRSGGSGGGGKPGDLRVPV